MNPKVLVVDDSLTVRMDLADAFTASGFEAIPCATASEARAAVARGPVDAIVLDVLLPDGNGVDLLDEFRAARGADVAIVMLSSEAEIADRIRGLQTGADEYIGKPYDSGYLIAKVEELIRRRAGQDASTVLVIDDSPTFRAVLRDALEAAGHRVLEAVTGEDGLRMVATRRPDAVVVDGMLPGIDGPTVIRHLRLDAALREVPCLLLTASDGKHAELRALDAGADAFVHKGEDLDVIVARVGAMVRRSPVRLNRDETASLLARRKILAVDDSPTFLHRLADTLKDDGYDVILARSGEEALQLLAVQTVDCILLDLMMPGLSGKETCERIKSAPVVRDIPLIMLTAIEDRTAMIEGLTAGADDYISKSSELEVLKARVRAQIRRKQFEDENRRIREELLGKELEAAEARAARELAETRAMLVDELERKNRELEAFAYSVSHDLRAPLRSISGFSELLLEHSGTGLDPKGREHLERVRAAAIRMGELIDDLLELSRVGRAELQRLPTDLSALAREVATTLLKQTEREVDLEVEEGVSAEVDSRLVRIVLENLIGNGLKFSAKAARPALRFGFDRATEACYVRDNGAGFDMKYVDRLFRPFQRLHSDAEFPGTGIGLATVARIVERHGGRVWAESELGVGSTFYFTLPAPRVAVTPSRPREEGE